MNCYKRLSLLKLNNQALWLNDRTTTPMCMLTKVNALSFWKKYRPKAPIKDKISATTFFEGFYGLVGQFPPSIWLQIAQVIEPPPSHTLNTNITLVELLQVLKKLQRNKVASLDGMKAKFFWMQESCYTCHY